MSNSASTLASIGKRGGALAYQMGLDAAHRMIFGFTHFNEPIFMGRQLVGSFDKRGKRP